MVECPWSYPLSHMTASHVPNMLECFFTRADSKLQWWIVNCDILNYQVYTRERRLCRDCGLAFQWGETKCGLFLCFSNMLIAISLEIEFYWKKCSISAEVVRRSRSSAPNQLGVTAFIQWFRCVIWDMHHWKTPPDHNCAIQIILFDANLCTHGPKY